jgi:hypothetical protein
MYVGQTNSFRNRLADHEKWQPSKRPGAIAVLATVIKLQSKRNEIEKELIQKLDPPLNKQIKIGCGLADAAFRQSKGIFRLL